MAALHPSAVWPQECSAFTLGGHRDLSLYRAFRFQDQGKQTVAFILAKNTSG